MTPRANSPAQATHRAGARAVPFAMALLLAGCDSPSDPAPLQVLSASAAEAAPLVGRLDVVLRSAAPLTVEYWAEDAPRLRVRSSASASHSVPLARLRPARRYAWQIMESGDTGAFETAPLPDDLAAVGFSATGAPTLDLVLVHLFHPDGFTGYAVVDAAGEVVWYWRTEGFPFGAARRDGGTFVFLDRGRGLVEVDVGGAVVSELPQDLARRELHHDAIATPWNTILFLAYDDRPFEGDTLRGEAIWEWTPETGGAELRWTSWDHLDPALDRGARTGGEWLHANALAVGPRGNVLVSLHFLDQVLSIAPGWDNLEWRLGGVNATLPVPVEGRFSGQHTAREVSPGRVVLFDNGVDRRDGSRALELDLSDGTVRVAWEWAPTRPNFAAAVSSARRLANGNTLVGFGLGAGVGGATGPTEFYEVDAEGRPLWHVEVGGTRIMFRAEPLAAIAGETVVAAP